MEKRMALILDPMLVTGETLIAIIDLLKEAGCKTIKGLLLVVVPESITGGACDKTLGTK